MVGVGVNVNGDAGVAGFVGAGELDEVATGWRLASAAGDDELRAFGVELRSVGLVEGKEFVLRVNLVYKKEFAKADERMRAYADHVFTGGEVGGDRGGIREGLHHLSGSPYSVAVAKSGQYPGQCVLISRRLRKISRDQTPLRDLEPRQRGGICAGARSRALSHVDHDGALGVSPLSSGRFRADTHVMSIKLTTTSPQQ